MSAAVALGSALLSLPFVALSAWSVHENGWAATGVIFGSVAATVLVILAGIFLITGGLS